MTGEPQTAKSYDSLSTAKSRASLSSSQANNNNDDDDQATTALSTTKSELSVKDVSATGDNKQAMDGQSTIPEQNKRQNEQRTNLSNQQNIGKLEELLSELGHLDIAINGGSLKSDLSHVRALLVHEIHKIYSQLPINLRRRYVPQMPSAMKRIVSLPFANGSPRGVQSLLRQRCSLQQQQHQMGTSSSIPSLLSATSFYAERNCSTANSFGSSSSLMTLPKYADELFLNNNGYLYRCDYAQHVRFENGQYTMKQRIHLPDNPALKIIGRILGPRGNSLRQLEAETQCRIVIRGKGSVKDPNKEKRLHGLPGWEHLDESLHVLIIAQHHNQLTCSRQLQFAVHCIRALLTPRFDTYKREQLIQLAIINGTYQPRT